MVKVWPYQVDRVAHAIILVARAFKAIKVQGTWKSLDTDIAHDAQPIAYARGQVGNMFDVPLASLIPTPVMRAMKASVLNQDEDNPKKIPPFEPPAVYVFKLV